MLSFDEGDDIFFDSAEYLSTEESTVVKEDLVCGNLGLGVWLKEPKSVQERRASFLREMGFVELAPSCSQALGKDSERSGLERIAECSGAVSSCCESQVDSAAEYPVCSNREMNGEANCAADEVEQDQSQNPNVPLDPVPLDPVEPLQGGAMSGVKECKNFIIDKNKVRSWWKHFMNKRKGSRGKNASNLLKPIGEARKVKSVAVQQKKKRYRELSAVYVGQEIHAHEGSILTMKFSPDGQYLASGGEDGVVRIWLANQADSSCKAFVDCMFGGQGKWDKSSSGKKKSSPLSVVIPEKVFQIEELPLQEFRGHTSDVLDLSWSKSNCLLSSSKDKTVRLWRVGCNECLSVFPHNDYVTCIQFNLANENYFISGSIDGKVRIWGVPERRVVDWVDIRDVVTAICYQPDGKGIVVGSIMGSCHFYGATDGYLQLDARVYLRGRKKSSNRITGIQFIEENSQRLMITSEDSKVRILDGIDIIHKYKGFAKSGSQMSASFTSNGRHIISVGEDSRIYCWNYDEPCVSSSIQTNSVRSCEHFFFEGVSLAIPWSGMEPKQKGFDCSSLKSLRSDSGCFSLANWFSIDGSFRATATWPEEKLTMWDMPVSEDDLLHCNHDLHPHHNNNRKAVSPTWGLVIVTAGLDGMIRTFHNYGLPVRI